MGFLREVEYLFITLKDRFLYFMLLKETDELMRIFVSIELDTDKYYQDFTNIIKGTVNT